MKMHLKSILIVSAVLFCFESANAQFGISARLQNNTNKTWNTSYQSVADTSQNLFSNSFEFGLNYWFRLKEYRIEFLPEISYAKSENSKLYSGLNVESHERTSYNFNLNVQIYPLDFIGDCNCPTFSKDGDLMSKGFYWLLSPGMSMHTLKTTMDPISSLAVPDGKVTSFRMGVGAGIDFGFTDMMTLSPFIMYSMNFGNAWSEQLQAYSIENPDNDSNSANINQWQFGVRLIFRPDYKS